MGESIHARGSRGAAPSQCQSLDAAFGARVSTMRMAPDEMAAMMGGEERPPTDNEAEMSYFTEFTTYFAYMLLIVVGHIRDFWGRTSGRTRWKTLLPSGKRGGTGMAPLFKSWENFYTRRLYDRIIDVFNRPICSSPGPSRGTAP